MNKEQIEFNKRQIDLIEKKIKYFLENKIYINMLINDLESLICHIKKPNQTWFKNFDDLIWDLEVLYACKLDENHVEFTKKEFLQIQEIIEKMKTLVEEYKKC